MKKTLTKEMIAESLKAYERLIREDLAFQAEQLHEGVFDPGILKCVFMAGGPGSGKSHTANDLFGVDSRFKSSFSTYGLKVVSSDVAFEFILKKNGIDPHELGRLADENPDLFQKITSTDSASLRSRAKRITNLQKKLYGEGKLGMIIDGTGENANKTLSQRAEAEAMGYDTFMVFVFTTLEVALARNKMRDRVLPEAMVKSLWNGAIGNMEIYQDTFGVDNFLLIDRSEYNTPIPSGVDKTIRAFIRAPIENPIGQQFLMMAKTVNTLSRM